MKMVTAIIRPAKLDDVIDALEVLGANKLTATEVRGIGRGTAARAQADDVSTIAPAEEIEIEVAVTNDLLQQVLVTLRAAARTGKPGDGKIIVTTLDSATRIRNGTKGEEAL
ncbi:MAG: P-II family nitrogen regulator [Burkholderiales bacterium]